MGAPHLVPTDRRIELSIGAAPGLADGLGAARHGTSRDAPAARSRNSRPEEFAAPQRSVGAEAEAVKSNAQDRAGIERDLVLGEAAGDMGMVMLNFREGNVAIAGELPPILVERYSGCMSSARTSGAWSNSQIERQCLLVV